MTLNPTSRPTFASFADALGTSASASTILSHDWSASSLGPIASWQRNLKTTITMVVRCPTPMALLWGGDGILIYNDGYAKVLGDKHPLALGQPVRDVWPDAADFNMAVIGKVTGGESLSYRDQFFVLERNGQSQRCWFDLDYSPVFDDTAIVGVLALVHEKTELMLVSRQLEREREQFVELFAQAPTIMAVLRGPEHRIERINPGYAQLIGHRDVLGKTVAEALPDAVDQGTLAMLDDTFRSGVAHSAVGARYAVQAVAGGPVVERFVDFVYQPIKDVDGVVTSIFVEGVDVTEREAAAAAKRASDIRNRQILDSAVDYAIVAFDPDGKVTQWNEGARRILGWTEEEILGMDGACFFTPEDRAAGRMQTEMRCALETGAGDDERWHMRKSGERFWASGEMTPLRNEQGEPVGFVKVLRDRTERRAAEQAFQESAEQFRILAQALPNQVWTAAPDGRLDWVNTQFNDYCGTVPVGPEGAIWTTLVHPDDVVDATEQWTRCIASGSPYEAEFRLRRQDGEYRWHLVRALPLRTAVAHAQAMAGHGVRHPRTQAAGDAEHARPEPHLEPVAGADAGMRLRGPDFSRQPGHDPPPGLDRAADGRQGAERFPASRRPGRDRGGSAEAERGRDHARVREPLPGQGRRAPAAQLDRGAGRRQDPCGGARHHPRTRHRERAAAVAEARSHRPAHRRRRARLQQCAGRHAQLDRPDAAGRS